MERKKFECRRCGRPFQTMGEGKEPECTHCGSRDVIVRPEKRVSICSCNARGRFT